MLYIWPYTVFFSFPLILPRAISTFSGLFPPLVRNRLDGITKRWPPLPLSSIPVFLFFCCTALAAVHYNTIIHPFTLADNRHYVFYVFRILRLHPVLKYLAAPVYILCGWATIQTLSNPQFTSPSAAPQDKPQIPVSRQPPRNLPSPAFHPQSHYTSFVLVWLATTALSVITAPLVEPRYFILLWVVWRLHVPALPPRSRHRQGSWARRFWDEYDHRLWFETGWFLLVNFVTVYVFLRRGFEWPQEPGKVQRFLW